MEGGAAPTPSPGKQTEKTGRILLACRWWRQSFLYDLLRLVCNQSTAEPCHTLSPPVLSQVGLKTGSYPVAAHILVIVTSRLSYRPVDRPHDRLFDWPF